MKFLISFLILTLAFGVVHAKKTDADAALSSYFEDATKKTEARTTLRDMDRVDVASAIYDYIKDEDTREEAIDLAIDLNVPHLYPVLKDVLETDLMEKAVTLLMVTKDETLHVDFHVGHVVVVVDARLQTKLDHNVLPVRTVVDRLTPVKKVGDKVGDFVPYRVDEEIIHVLCRKYRAVPDLPLSTVGFTATDATQIEADGNRSELDAVDLFGFLTERGSCSDDLVDLGFGQHHFSRRNRTSV